jgi:hypothetical protein
MSGGFNLRMRLAYLATKSGAHGVARPTCTGFQFVGIREIRVKAFCVSLQLKTAVFICVHPWLNSAPRPILDGEGEARLLREFSVKSAKTGAFSR